MDIYSRFMIALLTLVAVWYAHARLSTHLRNPTNVRIARVLLLGLGAVAGYYMAEGLEGPAALAEFAGWFGMVHLLPAFLLFIKDQSVTVRS